VLRPDCLNTVSPAATLLPFDSALVSQNQKKPPTDFLSAGNLKDQL